MGLFVSPFTSGVRAALSLERSFLLHLWPDNLDGFGEIPSVQEGKANLCLQYLAWLSTPLPAPTSAPTSAPLAWRIGARSK